MSQLPDFVLEKKITEIAIPGRQYHKEGDFRQCHRMTRQSSIEQFEITFLYSIRIQVQLLLLQRTNNARTLAGIGICFRK